MKLERRGAARLNPAPAFFGGASTPAEDLHGGVRSRVVHLGGTPRTANPDLVLSIPLCFVLVLLHPRGVREQSLA